MWSVLAPQPTRLKSSVKFFLKPNRAKVYYAPTTECEVLFISMLARSCSIYLLIIVQYSVFASIMTVGGMLGAVVSGKIADLIGRRGAMWFSDIFVTVGWLAILLAEGAWSLDLGRLSMGFGLGILQYAVSMVTIVIFDLLRITHVKHDATCISKQAVVYIAEITLKNSRGGFMTANSMMICGGVSFMFFIGNIFTWRTLAIFGMIPCLVQFLGLFFIPESPRWLAKIGREKELEDTIRRLRGKNVDIYAEVAMIKEYTKTFQQLSTANILTLFERRYAHPLIIGVGLMLLQQFGGANGILYYASSIFEAAGSGGVGVMVAIVCAAGTCLGNILVGLAFLLKDLHHSMELSAALVLSGILVYSVSYSLGVNGTPWVLMAEITRQYYVDTSKVVDEINLKFAKAREEILTTLDSKEIVYFDEGLLAKLPEKEKGAIQRSMGLKIEQSKAELDQLND
ncbi:hypothetical protein HYC85_016418 [Camellia sinensis]|uniref:Major facilitator superfamily (MFS) profile domain-containing protein n=1 Tax=Camellia sinensis TaxID=4442 RepID=A0A7J7GZV0_CAMSI|nr:hypothetical protein HYC85_016418 [Camellia sinensis]